MNRKATGRRDRDYSPRECLMAWCDGCGEALPSASLVPTTLHYATEVIACRYCPECLATAKEAPGIRGALFVSTELDRPRSPEELAEITETILNN